MSTRPDDLDDPDFDDEPAWGADLDSDVAAEADGEGETPFVPPADLPVHTSLTTAMQRTPPGGLMAVAVRVTSQRFIEDSPLDRPGYYHAIHLQDLDRGRLFEPCPTRDLDLCQTAQQLLLGGGIGVAYGRFLVDPPRSKRQTRSRNRFHLLHLRPVAGAAEMLGTLPDEVRAVRLQLDGLRAQPGAIAEFMESELAELHHVATEHHSPRFRRLVRLVLLQALSDGNVGQRQNPRLSTYFLSEPGQGKGVLSSYAQTLAPRSTTVQPPVISVPGLAVRMDQRKGQGWITVPGALARAHGGSCILQDLHRLPARDVRSYHPVLMSVCEEGVFTPAKVSDAPYQAQCALHINGNQVHVVERRAPPRGMQARLADLGTPLDLFSRIDVVVALCVGDSIEKVAIDVAKQQGEDRSAAHREEIEERTRRLKLLVAELRDQIPEVDLRPVEDEIATTLRTVQAVVREYAAAGGHEAALLPAALSLRMGRALRKLVAASARLDGRATATAADVEGAAEVLSLKLEVIKWLCGDFPAIAPQGSFAQQARRAELTAELRRHRLVEGSGGQGPLPLGELARRAGVDERTAARDLEQIGARLEDGGYLVPTPLEYELWQEAAPVRQRAAEVQREQEAAAQQQAAQPPNQVHPDEDRAAAADEAALRAQLNHPPADSLPRLPVLARPAIRALCELPAWDVDELGQQLLRFALAPELDAEMRVLGPRLVRVFCARLPDREVCYEAQLLAGAGLQEPDWERRAAQVLALYSALPLGHGRALGLGTALRGALPPPIRRHVESALQRCAAEPSRP